MAEMTALARRNLRHFIKHASFKCSVDQEAALNCLDVLEQEIDGGDAQVAVLRSAFAASESLRDDLLANADAPTPTLVNQGEAEILREAGHEQFEAVGGEAERAQIVAWLKGQVIDDSIGAYYVPGILARAIERGDHLTAQGGEG